MVLWVVVSVAAACWLVVSVIAFAVGGLLAEDAGTPPARVPAGAGGGLWLGQAWVDGRRTGSDLDRLAALVRRAGIRDLFAHIGPLSSNGSLDPALDPRARWLLTGLHRLLPGVRVQAWLGGLTGPGYLDLDTPATRARTLRTASGFLNEGFDGIHYDFEPVPSGDSGYLALLAATHTLTRERHAVLSVAADQIEPLPDLHTPEQWVFGSAHWWSVSYLSAIAARTDEIAVMTYNTAIPLGPAYSGYVRLETGLALDAAPARVTVLIGLPAYHTPDPGHTSAETVAAAIRGVRLALGDDPQRHDIGVAMYADFTATTADWAAYFADWVHLRRPAG